MRSKTVVFVGCLAALVSMLLAACGSNQPTTVPPTAGQTTSAPISTAPVATTAKAAGPVYGGWINVSQSTDIIAFDEVNTMIPPTFGLTNEELETGDWTKGPTGSNEADWYHTGTIRPDLWSGQLAETWESPEVGRLVYHIRKGVHYGLNPNSEASRLVNGRELTSADIAFSLRWLMDASKSYVHTAYPAMSAAAVITTPDKYTVEVKVPPAEYINAYGVVADLMHGDYPPEVVQKYGGMNDWRVSVGTGPFILTDFVSASSATFVKNPAFWEKDPMGPGKGSSLPYLDGVKYLIITDLSTRQAAARTAKLDWGGVYSNLEDAKAVTSSSPNIKTKRGIGHTGSGIAMKLTNPSMPYSDKRVRQALMYATDFNALKNDYYRGDAEIQSYPNPYNREYKDIFYPLAEMPQNVQDLYKYNPDKARALLKEAGFPNGFKANIVCWNDPNQVDLVSTYKGMWSKVGVDISLQPKEFAVYTSMNTGMTWDDLEYSTAFGGIGRYYSCNSFDGPGYFSPSQPNDAHVKEVKAQLVDLFNKQDWTTMASTYRSLMPYVLEQAWVIPAPIAYGYVLWWPWIKNYSGEVSVGYGQACWPKYVWLDQDVKKQITGR